MKNISLLGSTGSIGVQTLEVISQFPDLFNVVGLAAGSNVDLLEKQIREHRPRAASVKDTEAAVELAGRVSELGVEILHGDEGACVIAAMDDTDTVVSAMVGATGLKPTLAAVIAGKDIALANKETLVIAGELITSEAARSGSGLLPVDSEHNAIFQALECGNKNDVKRLILTASGGPFLDTPIEEMENATVEMALAHPTWKMGRKITIDSATLMNKGFEVIEARWLFGFTHETISVWIHPQSIVHSMVEYSDGSIIAQMSEPDMKIPIAYALSYPERLPLSTDNVRPENFGELNFTEVDYEKFPALGCAFESLREGGTMPAVLNAANEVSVQAFLERRIGFKTIIDTVRKVMDAHDTRPASDFVTVMETDRWARRKALSFIS